MRAPKSPIPLAARIVAVLMSLVVSSVGLLAVVTEVAPERSTRFGMSGPLLGDPAIWWGVVVFLAGLLPLSMLMGTARRAGWFGGIVGVLMLLVLFLGLRDLR